MSNNRPAAIRSKTGVYLVVCSSECQVRFSKSWFRKTSGDRFSPFNLEVPFLACVHCFYCGEVIVKPNHCQLHTTCPDYSLMLSASGVAFAQVWGDSEGTFVDHATWEAAQRLQEENNRELTFFDLWQMLRVI